MMQELVAKRHGGLGVTSFTIGLVSIFADVAIFGIAGYLKNSGQQTPAINMIVGFSIILLLGVLLLGVGLGIAGAADRTSKKVFPVLGIIICAIVFLLTAGLVGFGIWMVQHGLG